MFYYVYAKESKRDASLYIGYTNNLKERIEKHNRELVSSTKNKTPWHCIYFEACLNEEDAKRRERYLKTNQGARMLKRRLKEYFYASR